jgi:hypothetical protein
MNISEFSISKNRKKPPIILQSFKSSIKENYKYADKTRLTHKLVMSDNWRFFLARKRYWGESLLLSSLARAHFSLIAHATRFTLAGLSFSPRLLTVSSLCPDTVQGRGEDDFDGRDDQIVSVPKVLRGFGPKKLGFTGFSVNPLALKRSLK